MSGIKAWHVDGPVRSLRSRLAEWDADSDRWKDPLRVAAAEFRRDGRLSESEHSLVGGVVSWTTHSYDEKGLRMESQFQDGSGPVSRALYFYDEHGRMTRQMYRDPKGVETVTETWTYAEDGGKTRTLGVAPAAKATHYGSSIDGIQYYWNTGGADSIEEVHDARGLIVEVRMLSAAGVLLRDVRFTRDDAGKLVKDELTLGMAPLVPGLPAFGGGTALVTNLYSYDERGRRCELLRKSFSLEDEHESYRYDDRDNLVETTADRQDHQLKEMDDGSVRHRAGTLQRTQTRVAYQYDARGNWTERVTSWRDGVHQPFLPRTIERREIQYYSE